MAEKTWNFAGANILVMDPDPFSARLVAGILSGFGVQSTLVSDNPHDAGDLLRTGGIDAALLAICSKPDETLALIQDIRSLESGLVRFMPIIALTSQVQSAHIAMALEISAQVSLCAGPLRPQFYSNA